MFQSRAWQQSSNVKKKVILFLFYVLGSSFLRGLSRAASFRRFEDSQAYLRPRAHVTERFVQIAVRTKLPRCGGGKNNQRKRAECADTMTTRGGCDIVGTLFTPFGLLKQHVFSCCRVWIAEWGFWSIAKSPSSGITPSPSFRTFYDCENANESAVDGVHLKNGFGITKILNMSGSLRFFERGFRS